LRVTIGFKAYLAVVQALGDHDVAVERLGADPGNVAAFAGVDLAGGLALEEAAVSVLGALGRALSRVSTWRACLSVRGKPRGPSVVLRGIQGLRVGEVAEAGGWAVVDCRGER